MVGIDFTASNGDPKSPGSLHYYSHMPTIYEGKRAGLGGCAARLPLQGAWLAAGSTCGRFNLPLLQAECVAAVGQSAYLNPWNPLPLFACPLPVTDAISAVGRVLEFYDHDKMFPCYGFGAGLPPNNVTSHCFPLNGDAHNPEVAGVQGILEAYRCAEQGGRGKYVGAKRSTCSSGRWWLGVQLEQWNQAAPQCIRHPLELSCRHTLSTVRLSGPTLFAPLVNAAAQVRARHSLCAVPPSWLPHLYCTALWSKGV